MRETNIKMEGLKELEDLMIRFLPATVARREVLKGMRKSLRPTVTWAKAAAPRRSGALQTSIGMKTQPVRSTRKWIGPGGAQETFAAIDVGPLSGTGSRNALQAYAMYKAHYNKGKISLKKGAPIGRIRHGHLMEFGFNHKRAGRHIPGRRFLETAFNITHKTYLRGVTGEIRKNVLKAISKHNARSPARR